MYKRQVVSSAKTGATISGTNNVYLFQLVDENSAVYLKSGNALSTSLDDETAVTLTYAERQINGTCLLYTSIDTCQEVP